MIYGYSFKLKQKVEILEPVINIRKGKYIATGKDSTGNTISTMLSSSNALEYINSGIAKKGVGFKD